MEKSCLLFTIHWIIVSIAVDKLVEKSIVFDNRLNWIEGKAIVPLDYDIDHQHADAKFYSPQNLLIYSI